MARGNDDSSRVDVANFLSQHIDMTGAGFLPTSLDSAMQDAALREDDSFYYDPPATRTPALSSFQEPQDERAAVVAPAPPLSLPAVADTAASRPPRRDSALSGSKQSGIADSSADEEEASVAADSPEANDPGYGEEEGEEKEEEEEEEDDDDDDNDEEAATAPSTPAPSAPVAVAPSTPAGSALGPPATPASRPTAAAHMSTPSRSSRGGVPRSAATSTPRSMLGSGQRFDLKYVCDHPEQDFWHCGKGSWAAGSPPGRGQQGFNPKVGLRGPGGADWKRRNCQGYGASSP